MVIVVALSFLIPGGLLPAPSTPSPTVRTATTPVPGAVAFESPTEDAEGYWQILDTQWGEGYVDLRVRVESHSGRMTYSFYAFANSASEGVDPVWSPREPALSEGSIDEGKDVSGWMRFEIPRENATLVLATVYGRQVSALQVNG